MILYGTLLLAALLAALLVYRYDMYEREPWWMIVLAVACGAATMWVLGHVEDFTLNQYGEYPRPSYIIATVAATHEEIGRLLIVVLFAALLPRQFNDPMDGIIYGSMVGLGMAIEESIFYTALEGARTDRPLPPQEIIRLCGHLIMGGITGFAIGHIRMRLPRAGRVLIGCVTVSMALHFSWDWLAFSIQNNRMTALQTIAAIAIMLFGILFYGVLVVVGSDWSRRHFAPHDARQLFGWPLSLLVRRDEPQAPTED